MISKYSIAVLPFVNISSDKENEYFSDGITEEILNALSKLEDLHVTSRTSSFAFRNQNLAARDIGEKLNVAFILEGSVRKSGDFVRITAQLINAEDDFHIWSSSWDKELKNIFVIQDEIAADIAEKIKLEFKSPDIQKAKPIHNTKAVDLYLKGMYIMQSWSPDDVYQAINCFKQALLINPDFAKVYISLAGCYTILGTMGHVSSIEAFEQNKKNVQKAYELDPDLPEVYMGFANQNFWHEWDVQSAIENLNKALKLKPSNDEALLFKGMVVAATGNFEESLDCLFQAERLNPLSEMINYCLGSVYTFTQEYDRAIDYFDKNTKISSRFYAQYQYRVLALIKSKRFEEAWIDIQNLPDVIPNKEFIRKALLGIYYSSKGQTEKALEFANYIEDNLNKDYSINSYLLWFLTTIYLNLDQNEKALNILEYSVKERVPSFIYMAIDDQWEKLSNEPRFQKALEQIKFPEDIKAIHSKYEKSGLSKDQSEQIVKKLYDSIKENKLFLNSRLTLSDLAESIDESSNLVSQVLNESIGKNFYEFINSFRLEHFLTISKDPKYKQFTLLSIAYESGFNSKTTFNTYFKKKLGKPPSDYFKN